MKNYIKEKDIEAEIELQENFIVDVETLLEERKEFLISLTYLKEHIAKGGFIPLTLKDLRKDKEKVNYYAIPLRNRSIITSLTDAQCLLIDNYVEHYKSEHSDKYMKQRKRIKKEHERINKIQDR